MTEIVRRMNEEVPASGMSADPYVVPVPSYECSTTGPTKENVIVTATAEEG